MRRSRGFGIAVVLLLAAFAWPLAGLWHLAWSSDLYSYIPLIPLVSLYLAWGDRAKAREAGPPSLGPGIAWAMGAAAGLALYAYGRHRGWVPDDRDRISWLIACLWAAIVGAGLLAGLGKAFAFPLGFLIFSIPIPGWLFDRTTVVLQYGSAWVAHGLLAAAFTPFERHGLFFHFADITIQVAPECSGIHSTVVLLITSVLAAHLFLRTPGRRAALVVAVLPLALLRNGFRIFVISELCVWVGPWMIDSYIHHHGGPIFFALSLIPFFYFLRYLRSAR